MKVIKLLDMKLKENFGEHRHMLKNILFQDLNIINYNLIMILLDHYYIVKVNYIHVVMI